MLGHTSSVSKLAEKDEGHKKMFPSPVSAIPWISSFLAPSLLDPIPQILQPEHEGFSESTYHQFSTTLQNQGCIFLWNSRKWLSFPELSLLAFISCPLQSPAALFAFQWWGERSGKRREFISIYLVWLDGVSTVKTFLLSCGRGSRENCLIWGSARQNNTKNRNIHFPGGVFEKR